MYSKGKMYWYFTIFLFLLYENVIKVFKNYVFIVKPPYVYTIICFFKDYFIINLILFVNAGDIIAIIVKKTLYVNISIISSFFPDTFLIFLHYVSTLYIYIYINVFLFTYFNVNYIIIFLSFLLIILLLI